jgi:small-conductance mechanosensitive channel
MIFFISSDSVVISPFSFLILLIRILSLCPLISLARGLSILLILSKNHLLVWLIFFLFIFYWVFISFTFPMLSQKSPTRSPAHSPTHPLPLLGPGIPLY